MSLLDLPNELLLLIAGYLEYTWDINALCRVSRDLHTVLSPYLDKLQTRYCNPGERFLLAARNGSSAVLQELLREGILHSPWSQENKKLLAKAVCYTAAYGDIETARLLLGEKQIIDLDVSLALWSVALVPRSGSEGSDIESMIRLLLDHGANPFDYASTEKAVEQGNLPFIKAMIDWGRQHKPEWFRSMLDNLLLDTVSLGMVTSDHVDIARYVLGQGADPDARDHNNATPICHAADRGHLTMVRVLLEHGADPFPVLLPRGSRWNPLFAATRNGHADVAECLLRTPEVYRRLTSRPTGSLLRAAALCGSGIHVRMLLEKAGGRSLSCKEKTRALAAACRIPDCHEAAELLLHHGALPSSTALLNAINIRSVHLVRLLLHAGAKPDATALINAVRSQYLPVVELLLDAGIDPNTCWTVHESEIHRRGKVSVLHLALGHARIFELLLDRGADATLFHTMRDSTMMHALASGCISSVQMLLDRGLGFHLPRRYPSSYRYGILCCATVGGTAMLDFLFSRGYQYPSPDIQERRTTELYPPLEIAISRRDIPAVKFLLERGVNLPHNGRLLKIFTELLTSGNDGDVKTELEIIDLLLCQGATLNPRDELFGHHPCLHQLIPCRDVSVLCALLDRGANPLLYCNTTDGGTNRDERCALDLAVLHDFPDGLAVMLEKVWGTVEESERGYVGFVVSRVKEIARSEKKSRCLRVLERFEYGRGLHLIEAQRNGGNGYFYDVSRKKEVSTGRNCLSCGGSKGGFCACLEEYVW